MSMGRFLDKKNRLKKFFVYAHFVPVDIHTVIHSLQPLFLPCRDAGDGASHVVATINVALAQHWW